MKPVFNLEPKYRVTMLKREEWTSEPGIPPAVKGLVWFTDGSRTLEGTGAGLNGQFVGRRLSIFLVFQAEIYEILACVHEIETQYRPGKYVSICSVGQAAVQVLHAARTTYQLVRQCQKALNDTSTRHTVGLYWVPGHAGVRGNEIADKLARVGSVQKFVGPELFLGASKQNIRRKIKRGKDSQHLVLWRGPCRTQRQARELIWGPNLATRVRLLSFNRTRSRAVIGLLIGHNTMIRHLYVMGLRNKPICRNCGTTEETPVNILCACQALASHRHSYLGSFFLEPEDIRKLNIGDKWNFGKGTGLL